MYKAFTFITIIISSILVSCTEWTPEAVGYFSVDGQRYNVHLTTLRTNSYSKPSDPAFYNELIFSGAPNYYITMSITSPSNALSNGTYPYEYYVSSDQMKISYYRVRYGSDSKDFDTNIDSQGSMVIEISGSTYTFDFSGIIEGHSIKMNYVGMIKFESL